MMEPWKEPEGPETAIAIVRSAPIPIRFEVRTTKDDPDAIGLVAFFGERRLAMRPVTPARLEAILASPAWHRPLVVTALGSYEPETGALVLALFAEVTERWGWIESEEMQIPLGCRYRGRQAQAYPGELERETRDFFLSLLQGNPRRAVGRLLHDARRESVRRHEHRLRNDGHPPARDIAEGLGKNRIRKEIDR